MSDNHSYKATKEEKWTFFLPLQFCDIFQSFKRFIDKKIGIGEFIAVTVSHFVNGIHTSELGEVTVILDLSSTAIYITFILFTLKNIHFLA